MEPDGRGPVQLQLYEIHHAVRNFPAIPEPTVDRSHVVATIAQILTPETSIVFLEGDEGCGATTLLAQFCLAFPDQVFALFIKPVSRFAYSVDYLRLVLAEQFNLYLTGAPLEREAIDVSEFHSLLFKLRRRRKRTPIYFVIDGLHQVPAEDHLLVSSILREVLPLGVDHFRFVITGVQANYHNALTKAAKSYQVLKFSRAECDFLLADVVPESTERSELEKLCRGNPGRMWSVRRLIQNGTTASSILQSGPSQYLAFIGLEFSELDRLPEPSRVLVASLAFARHSITRPELLQICGATEDDLAVALSACPFLSINAGTGCVEFISETHRRFAEKKLAGFRNRVLSLQVEHLRDNATSIAALRMLPTYYQQLEQTQAIINLLSPEHFSGLLEATQSYSALRTRAALGVKSAIELRQATNILQFALQRSIFLSAGTLGDSDAEVSALVALGQPQRALTVAAQEPSKEGRLRLIAAYARKIRENGGTIDSDVASYIRELAGQIDFSELGEDSTALAEDLLFADPNVAFSIIDEASKAADDNGGFRSAAYIQLSFAAHKSSLADKATISELTRSRIADDTAQKLLSSLRAIVDSSIDEIITISETMDIGRRIFFLRHAALAGQSNKAILSIVDFALDQLVRHTEYTPKAKDLADLAAPLAHNISDAARLDALIKRIESQMGLIEANSPTKDLVNLQMRLAHAEMSFDRERARARITGAYYEVAARDIGDIKADCYALMLRALARLDKESVLEKEDGFRQVIQADLLECIKQLFAGTADQLRAVRAPLKILAAFDPEAALAITKILNTEDRRDIANRDVALAIVESAPNQGARDCLAAALGRIQDRRVYDEAIQSLFASAAGGLFGADWISELQSAAASVQSPRHACLCAVSAIPLLLKAGVAARLEETLALFQEKIEEVGSTVTRVDLFFSMASAIGPTNLDAATRLYEQGVATRTLSRINTDGAIGIITRCLQLIVRCFRPLIRTSGLPDQYLARFARLCDSIPCLVTRGAAYCDLIVRAWCEDKRDISSQLVRSYCHPLLELAKATGTHTYGRLIAEIIPALYCGHKATALSFLDVLSPTERGRAVRCIADVIICKASPYDPSTGDAVRRARITHEDALDVVELLERAPTDSDLYGMISDLADAATSRESRTALSAQQRADVEGRILSVIAKKLPDPLNIQHQGYVIVATASAWRLSEHSFPEWSSLIAAARQIPNVADVAYVLMEIVECLPARFHQDALRLLGEARTTIRTIPSLVDRHSRLRRLSEIAKGRAPALMNGALKDALSLTFEMGPDRYASQLRLKLADLAESLEPGLADKLVEMIDNDPARSSAKRELQTSAEIKSLKRDLVNKSDEVKNALLASDKLPQAAWQNVSALISGRLETKPPDVFTRFLNAAGSFTLSDAFPVLFWYVENCSRRFSTASDVSQKLTPLCEALLLSSELAESVIAFSSSNRQRSLQTSGDDTDGMLIRPKDRASAIEFIRSWIRNSGREHIMVCDPYFTPADVDLLRLVIAERPSARVSVITSKRQNENLDPDEFVTEWRRIMDQDPPETELIVVNVAGQPRTVLHDRWIVSESEGLRLGTSFNSIGVSKLSEISVLEANRALEIAAELQRFVRRERVFGGSKLSYSSFTL